MTRPDPNMQTAEKTERPGRWPIWKLGLLLYPFATAAVAINLFMLALLGHVVGLAALSPYAALWVSLPLGLPATWAAAKWVRSLIDTAEA